MNALVSFRANMAGTLSVRREERQQAKETIASTFRARLEGIQRALNEQLGAKSAELAAGAASAASPGPGADKAVSGASEKAAVNSSGGAPNNQLGRDAFLQLLVQQLSNQDPLEPVDNQQMLAQLAQFSSLEQMERLNRSFEVLSQGFDFLNGNVDQLNFISAQGLLGKFVEGLGMDGKLQSGTVESVHLDGSIVVLTVDGKPMPMSGVIGISTQSFAAQSGKAKPGTGS